MFPHQINLRIELPKIFPFFFWFILQRDFLIINLNQLVLCLRNGGLGLYISFCMVARISTNIENAQQFQLKALKWFFKINKFLK